MTVFQLDDEPMPEIVVRDGLGIKHRCAMLDSVSQKCVRQQQRIGIR